MANEGFTVDAAAPPTENTLKKSPTPKRSPAKVGEEIVTEVVEQTLKEQLVEAGTVAAIEGGAQLGAEALRDKKKSRRSTNMGGFSKLQFGRQ